MTEHIFVEHANCEEIHCPICDGGLAVCSVCDGAEGSLPSECPGSKMDGERQGEVYRGLADFKNGQWTFRITPQ